MNFTACLRTTYLLRVFYIIFSSSICVVVAVVIAVVIVVVTLSAVGTEPDLPGRSDELFHFFGSRIE